jgi:predicted Zn-dependent protease with MMP-like domain
MERIDEAATAYDAVLSIGRDDLELLLDSAEFYAACGEDLPVERDSFDRALELSSRGARLAEQTANQEAFARFVMIEARALVAMGRPHDALRRLDAALARCDLVEILVERGVLLYELCRFQEAREQLLHALGRDASSACANHTLGLIAERCGNAAEAHSRLALARRLSPDEFSAAVELSADAFDRAVEDALASLPGPVRHYLANVAIAVEDLPADDDLLASDPPLSPSILGMFRGSPLRDKASMDPWSHFPSSIVLYQKNLQRFARDHAELVEQIGITLVHEVGHFLGLDEHELWERGLR